MKTLRPSAVLTFVLCLAFVGCTQNTSSSTSSGNATATVDSKPGVYLLVCKDTGKHYVGRAKGEESLWGRLGEYARMAHGGNVELKRLGLKNFQATVLEAVNSDTQEIEQIEAAWQRKLLSR